MLTINRIIVTHELAYDKEFFQTYCKDHGIYPTDDEFYNWVAKCAAEDFAGFTKHDVSMEVIHSKNRKKKILK